MRQFLRRRIAAPVFVLFVAVFAGGWVLSRSEIAHRLVERKLEERFGANAEFDRVRVGLTDTTVANLRLHERGSGPDSLPFLTVANVDIDVGAVGAILDKSPSTICLRDARVLLRFDRHGELLTRLPNNASGDGFPNFKIESGTLTIRQEGRADSVFLGIDMTITGQGQNLALTGTIHDQNWGNWTAEGSIPIALNGNGQLSLRTDEPQRVTPELLRQVPLVNPKAWNYVCLAGITPACIVFKFDASDKRAAYRLELDPTETTIEIPNVGLRFTDAAGKLVAEAGVVKLTDVRSNAADGQVRVDSRLDFSKPDSVLRFHANLSGMDVQKLPRTWRLPPQIDGRLSGQADFVVTLSAKGGTRLDVTGRATITDAKLKGRPIPPIELDVVSGTGGRVEFVERSPKIDPIRPVAGTAPPPALVVANGPRLPTELAFMGDGPPAPKDYVRLNVALRDIEVAELLKSAGVHVATNIGGKATLQVQIEIPTDAPDDFKKYRLTGTARARSLTIDELAIADVSAALDLRDGKLLVRDFVGRLPALGAANGNGKFTAQGELDADAPYAFHATVKLDRVALEQVDRLKSLLPVSVALAGEASADAELTGTLSPLTIRGSGKAAASQIQVGKVPAQDLSFNWHAANDLVHLHDASVRVFGGKINGQFDIPLRGAAAGSGSAKIEEIDLGELSKLLLNGGNVKLEGKAGGTLKVRGGANGTTADMELAAPNLKFQGIAAKKIKATGAYAAGVVKYVLTAAALGGQIEVSGQYPQEKKPTPKPADKKIAVGLDFGQMKVKRIQMADLWDLLGVKSELAPMAGELSGEFPLTFDDEGRLLGAGSIYAERMSWKGHEMAGVGQAIVRVTPESLSVNEATLYMGEGLARISATHNRVDPGKSGAEISLTNVPARRLMFLFPELAKRLNMNVSGRLSTSFGKEWRGSGVLTATKGRAFGISVTDVRVPISWTIAPTRGRTEVRVRDASATAAGGTITARSEISLFNDLPPRFSGEVQFRNANVSQAFRDAGKSVGNLQLTGKLEFAAEQYRGADDLTGKLNAKLGESQPFSLPVLAAVVPYLGVGRDYSTTIQEGEVHAVLGRGVWRVEQLTLTGPSLDLFAEGSLTLGGRLNGTVTARSGERPAQTLLRRFMPASALTTISPSSLQLNRSALTDAASLVGSYVVYMEVNGTVESPSVRLQTVRTLSDATVRFFLFRFLMPL